MTLEDLKGLALKLNEGKLEGAAQVLYKVLQLNARKTSELDLETVEGWLLGEPIDTDWLAVIDRVAKRKISLNRDECARIQQWFKYVPSDEFSRADVELIKKISN